MLSFNHVRFRICARPSTLTTREETGYSLYFRCVSSAFFLVHAASSCNNPASTVSSQKRKRDKVDSDDEEHERIDPHLSSDEDDVQSPDEHEQADYRAQKLRGKGAGPPKKKGKPKAPKRTRVIKVGDARETSARKSKKPQANGDASNVNKVPQDFKINTDNALFSAC